MLNYINELKNKLELVKRKLNTEENKFKKIELNIEFIKLENKINFCIDLVINKFQGKSILDLANIHISPEKITNALEETKNFNEIVIGANIQKLEEQKKVIQNLIKKILDKNPNIENDEFKETEDYKELVNLRENILELDGYVDEENQKKKTFIDFLDMSDKLSFIEKILENYQDEKTIEELLKQAIDYKPKLDLLRDADYPLFDRFNELTENKDNSLAQYLIENKENIERLTVTSSTEVINDHYGQMVTEVEHKLGDKRVNDFNLYAKEKGISDIINTKMGQFNNRKVYYNEKNYKRFFNTIQELQSSTETKDKIKRLLKKLDSLDILDENANASESRDKEYGFIRFIKARFEFINAMKENPANEEKIKNTLENLKKEEHKINEIFQAIKEELGDEYETMPSNVDSYRNKFVPPCFKDNLVINAKFNSLFIMLTFIKEKNLNIDNFVDYPVELSNICLKEYIEKNNIDNILKGKTKGDAILYLSKNKKDIKIEDIVKYSRSFELIYKTETNKKFQIENDITSVAFGAYGGDINRIPIIGNEYFNGDQLETLQNIFMAKEDSEGKISYLDCHITKLAIQDDFKTSLALDEKTTIVEKIKLDENIENTFYEAINALKRFVNVKGISKKINYNIVDANKMLDAIQTLAAKIIVTLDFDISYNEENKIYTDKFMKDVFNIIENYKEVDELKDLNFRVDNKRLISMINVVNDREKFIKDFEKKMNDEQNVKENRFIQEFERINKEIDLLDKQVDKISKKLRKGETNKAIEDIAAEQQKKFIELRQLQNNRIKELKDDVKKGMISKFYFEKRTEQVLLLDNIKDKPAMFMCDDKNYKNFKTYAKEVKKINIKDLSSDKLRLEETQYNLLIQKSLEDKRLYLINNIFADHGLSMRKSINFNKYEEINIKDNINEMKVISDELITSNQKIKNEQELSQNKVRVNIIEESEINISEKVVEEENNDLIIQKIDNL